MKSNYVDQNLAYFWQQQMYFEANVTYKNIEINN